MSCLVEIHYCTGCKWLTRAAWMAQELLSTFEADITGLTLVPGTGGIFQVYVNSELVWCRKLDDGFPEIKVLKQKVRDVIDPDRSLGHVDS